jgi:alpha-1,2-mannosyltransferase
VNHASARALPGTSVQRVPGSRLSVAGGVAFGAIIVSWLVYKYTHKYDVTLAPVDLHVYYFGGLIVRHTGPYNSHLASPLYDWSGYSPLHLPFDYPPFAAVIFAVISFIPWSVLPKLSVVANMAFLVIALWFTYGGLGYRSRQVRLGATLLTAAAVFWTEPVIRTIYLGQVNLALMALIMWDMCQPDRRWWKGAGVGIAAGIKLVPGVFILYLLATRRWRQAIAASAAFLATILLAFIVAPADSAKYWFTGLFWNGSSKAGFLAWEGNQSMRALVARVMGSLAGSEDVYLLVAVLTLIVGIGCAALLDRKGYRMAALMATALTGLLASPISWDHHWVWIVPCVAVAAHYAVQAMAARARGARPGQGTTTGWQDWAARARLWASSRAGWGCWAVVVVILGAFGAWPETLWGNAQKIGPFSLGLLWYAPGTGMGTYEKYGDLPTYPEYRWHGLNLLAGNDYVLCGIGLIILLLILARYAPYPQPAVAGPAQQPDAVPAAAGSAAEEPAAVPAVAAGAAAGNGAGPGAADTAAAGNGARPGKPADPEAQTEPAAGQSAGTGLQSPSPG